MQKMRLKYTILFLTISVVLPGCQDKKSEVSHTAPGEQQAKESGHSTQQKAYYVYNSKSGTSISIVLQAEGTEPDITIDGQQYQRVSSEHKRSYYDSEGQLLAIVKYREGSFKLYDASNHLQWKVKAKTAKIKIANNEEMEAPYQLKQYDNGKLKLKRNEEELLSWVLSKSQHQPVSFKNGYQLTGFASSLSSGIYGIDELTSFYATILVSELIELGF